MLVEFPEGPWIDNLGNSFLCRHPVMESAFRADLEGAFILLLVDVPLAFLANNKQAIRNLRLRLL